MASPDRFQVDIAKVLQEEANNKLFETGMNCGFAVGISALVTTMGGPIVGGGVSSPIFVMAIHDITEARQILKLRKTIVKNSSNTKD